MQVLKMYGTRGKILNSVNLFLTELRMFQAVRKCEQVFQKEKCTETRGL